MTSMVSAGWYRVKGRVCHPACGSDNRSWFQDNEHLIVSAPERTILEALVVSPNLPAIQTRASVVLRAGEGMGDEQIATELLMKLKDVRHWRKRFAAQGVRGLWDSPGPGPKKRVSPEKERAILWEVLYAVPALNWSTQQLAGQHRLSRSAVNRIFTKHGIVRDRRGRIDMDHWKVFADALFGVTVSGIAGLYYYGASRVLALVSTSRPFSELHLSEAGVGSSEAINGFMDELDKLTAYCRSHGCVPYLKGVEETVFVSWLNTMEARREPVSEVYLLMAPPNWTMQGKPGVQEWLREHPHFKVIHAPGVSGSCWHALVRRCLRIIFGLPMQVNFVEDIKGMTQYLTSMSDPSRARIISVWHRPQQ
jgi:transposase